jgi:hypothetical protein
MRFISSIDFCLVSAICNTIHIHKMRKESSQQVDMNRTLVCLAFILIVRTEAAFIGNPYRTLIRSSKIQLQNKQNHLEYSDFGSYGDRSVQDEEAQQLTTEFYQELRERQARGSLDQIDDLDGDKRESSKGYFSKPSTADPPQFAFFSFPSFFNPPAPAPSSAGLFSGTGQTAYSSGRSIRADTQLLESSLNKQVGTPGIIGWHGTYVQAPEQFEQLLRAAAGTIIILSATYLAMELSGGLTIVFPWEEAVFGEIFKDGISNVWVVLGDGVGDAAWFVEESSALVGSVGQAVVKSMEGLVLL